MNSQDHTTKLIGSTTPGAGDSSGNDLEPTASNRPLPALLLGVVALMLYLGEMYVMNHGGDLLGQGGSFPEQVYYPLPDYAAVKALQPKREGPDPEQGRFAYATYCQPCHQISGLGMPGQYPPLAGSDWVQAEGPNRIIRIVLDGISGPIKVNGQEFNNAMVPWRDTIKDDVELAALLTFIRSEWGNKSSEVTVEKVKAIREATKDRAGRPWTAEELLAIPVSD